MPNKVKSNPVVAVSRESDMGWLLCFVLILVMLIGRQFSTGDHGSGYAAKKTPSITRTAPGANSAGDPATRGERTGSQTP
jgi:hypothetical protein